MQLGALHTVCCLLAQEHVVDAFNAGLRRDALSVMRQALFSVQ